MEADVRFDTAAGIDELADTIEYALRDMGFTGFVYWTHVKKPVEDLKSSDVFLLSRGPASLKAFEAMYLARAMYLDDPIFLNAGQYHQPFTSEAARAAAQPSRRRRWLYLLEERFGFKYDLNVPIHTPLRVQVLNAYCVGRDPAIGARIEAERDALVRLATRFAAAIVDFVMLGFEDDTWSLVLSRRQQECLSWMAKGRTNSEIAAILGCSERTVKFHVAELMKRLGAANRTEAVAIAARQGWIVN